MSDDDEYPHIPSRRRATGLPMPEEPAKGFGIAQAVSLFKNTILTKKQADFVQVKVDLARAIEAYARAELDAQKAYIEGQEFDPEKYRAEVRESTNAGIKVLKATVIHADAELRGAEALHELKLDELKEVRHNRFKNDLRRQKERERLTNPPPEPKPKTDAVFESIENLILYGAKGKATAFAEKLIAEIIAQVGGEHNLTEEQRDNIMMARAMAAQKDNSKGGRG